MFYNILCQIQQARGNIMGPGVGCHPQQLAPLPTLGVGLEPHLSGLKYQMQGCVSSLACQGQQVILCRGTPGAFPWALPEDG